MKGSPLAKTGKEMGEGKGRQRGVKGKRLELKGEQDRG